MPLQTSAIDAPPIVLGLILSLLGIHLVREFLSVQTNDLIILWGAFWPARYATVPSNVLGSGWNEVVDFTSPLTYGLLHGSWTHVGLNCIWLLAFGTPVARRLGTPRFLLLYVVSGIAGALLFLSFHWGEVVPVIGASASISGLTGGVARLAFRRHRSPSDVSGPLANLSERGVVVFVLLWFGVNLVFGLVGVAGGISPEAIAWEAHVGGFVVGLVVFPLLDRPPPVDPIYRRNAGLR
jgi:membrane associated rhomboid family serine protease